MKSFCGGSRGAVFSKRVPLAAGGKDEEINDIPNFGYAADVFGCHGNIG
jgi:hypothetical protein